MGRLKQTIRRHAGPRLQRIAFDSGLMEVLKRRSGQGGALVLMYHSVAGPDDEPWIDPRNHVSAEVFAEQMAFLAAHRMPISLQALAEQLRAGRAIEDGAVVVTFDDGYRDNLAVAAPILARWNIPATLFVPTAYIDRGETQWVDQAYTAFRCRTRDSLEWGEPASHFALGEPAEYQAAYQAVCSTLLRAGPGSRRDLLDRLLEALAPDRSPPRLTLNWDEVRELTAKFPGFSIGGHTVEHTDLTSIPVEAAHKELQRASHRIEEQLGVAPRHFSFCYGRSSDDLRAVLGGLGIEVAFGGCKGGPVISAGADPLRLPRVEGPREMRMFDLATSTANTGFWRRLSR